MLVVLDVVVYDCDVVYLIWNIFLLILDRYSDYEH